MFIFKRKHNQIIAKKNAEISELKKYINDREEFVSLGIEYSQKLLRGYKFIDLTHWPQSAFFSTFVKFFNSAEGGTKEKLADTLLYIHKKTNYYTKANEKFLLRKLEKVTSVSPYTGSNVPCQINGDRG